MNIDQKLRLIDQVERVLTDPTVKSNSGHGWVYENESKSKARCGGPGICKMCADDLKHKQQGEKAVFELLSAPWFFQALRTGAKYV